MTIWSHSSQNGSIAFADNDSNFRGAVQYIHNGDNLRFLTAGNETLRMTANGGTVIHKNATVHYTDSGWAALEVRANSDQHTLVLSSQSNASNVNKATLKENLEDLIKDKKKVSKKGEEAKIWVNKKHNIKKVSDELYTYYKSIGLKV